MNSVEIKLQAEKELQEENNRILIDKMKDKLKSKKWWHKIWPYKIVIIRRD